MSSAAAVDVRELRLAAASHFLAAAWFDILRITACPHLQGQAGVLQENVLEENEQHT